MKSLAELAAIKDKMRHNITVREEGPESAARIVVGMATCGIAAGARPVLNAIMEEIAKRGLEHVTVAQTGCIGMCKLEPMVEVFMPGKEKVTYVLVTPEKVGRIIAEHVINGRPVAEFTIGAYEK
jgi:NADP-reducing hydrogenase subunit HndB